MATVPGSIEAYRTAIEQTMRAEFERAHRATYPDPSSSDQQIIEVVRGFYLRPGRRLRGCLSAAAYDAGTGASCGAPGLRLGAAVELIQAYLLIIDDVMDQSEMRRGEASLQVLFEREWGLSEYDSGMMAVNAGLIAQHLAGAMLADVEAPAEYLVSTSRLLHQQLVRTGFGQVRDMTNSLGEDVALEDIIRGYELKCAYYSFVGPLQCGFALAGQHDAGDDCERFGRPAGALYQLRNDVNGLGGDTLQGITGTYADVRGGKATWLWQHAYQHASKADKSRILSAGQQKTLSQNKLRELSGVLVRTGSVDAAERLAEELEAVAQEAARTSTLWDDVFAEKLCALVTLP